MIKVNELPRRKKFTTLQLGRNWWAGGKGGLLFFGRSENAVIQRYLQHTQSTFNSTAIAGKLIQQGLQPS